MCKRAIESNTTRHVCACSFIEQHLGFAAVRAASAAKSAKNGCCFKPSEQELRRGIAIPAAKANIHEQHVVRLTIYMLPAVCPPARSFKPLLQSCKT